MRGLKSVGIDPSTLKSSRTLHGCVDWNWYIFHLLPLSYTGRTLHGCVDWNILPPLKMVYRHVAPFTGAWIEIVSGKGIVTVYEASHPSRVRGLKFDGNRKVPVSQLSHPSRVRGLKLLEQQNHSNGLWSHPSRVRGLKFRLITRYSKHYLSHPSRVRGLKFFPLLLIQHIHQVAPFTGAWIEISRSRTCSWGAYVAPFTGAWIEINWLQRLYTNGSSRTLHGCVDWNVSKYFL